MENRHLASAEQLNVRQTPQHLEIVFYGIIVAFLVFFFIVEALVKKYKPLIGHETSATILLGIIFSFTYYRVNGQTFEEYNSFKFKPNVFFNFVLPLIIFNSGFNMKQKKFFLNLGNIMITGICVTFVCFVIYSAATYFAITRLDLTMTRYVTGPGLGVPETLPIEIPFMTILMFTALVCSSDVVAAVSIVDYEA